MRVLSSHFLEPQPCITVKTNGFEPHSFAVQLAYGAWVLWCFFVTSETGVSQADSQELKSERRTCCLQLSDQGDVAMPLHQLDSSVHISSITHLLVL